MTEDVTDARFAAAVDELFARRPERMAPGLERIEALLDVLGHPEQAAPAVQLTGTNGKTSTAMMVGALFGALGLTAGTYTSPHLQDVRERIRVGPEMIGRSDFVARLDELRPLLAAIDDAGDQQVSFFEALTGLAFAHFADAPVDVAVFEVGLGGRWDATNLARGEVAVLGPIALDHSELGLTVEAVAAEKVGIVKPGAVVVSAPQAAAVDAIVAQAVEDAGGQLVRGGRDVTVADRRPAVGGQVLDLQGVTGTFEEVFLPLHGAHQALNAGLALAAVEGFLGFAGGIDPDVVRAGFAAVRSPGRLEPVRRYPEQATVLLDGAHNPAGAAALALALGTEFAFRHRVVVLGVLGDKDVEGVVAALAPVSDHVVVCAPPTGRAADVDRVAKAVAEAGLSVETAAGVADALEAARGIAGGDDGVVVTGSLYTVGAARDALGLPAA